jgi:hypothetical protein
VSGGLRLLVVRVALQVSLFDHHRMCTGHMKTRSAVEIGLTVVFRRNGTLGTYIDLDCKCSSALKAPSECPEECPYWHRYCGLVEVSLFPLARSPSPSFPAVFDRLIKCIFLPGLRPQIRHRHDDRDAGRREAGPIHVGVDRVAEAGERPPPPRTKWTRRVTHPVLIGHAASLSQANFLKELQQKYYDNSLTEICSVTNGGDAQSPPLAFHHMIGTYAVAMLFYIVGLVVSLWQYKPPPLVLSGHAASLTPY